MGPARPLTGETGSLVGSSWLFDARLSGGAEITYHGRRGYHLRVARDDGELPIGPVTFFPADAIVDAETGCLLRLISYADDVPAMWWELDDITAEPGETADPAGFRPHIPPGARVMPESGHPLADGFAVMPGLTGTAAAPPRRPSAAQPTPSRPPGASWTTCAAGTRLVRTRLVFRLYF